MAENRLLPSEEYIAPNGDIISPERPISSNGDKGFLCALLTDAYYMQVDGEKISPDSVIELDGDLPEDATDEQKFTWIAYQRIDQKSGGCVRNNQSKDSEQTESGEFTITFDAEKFEQKTRAAIAECISVEDLTNEQI